MGDEHAEVYRLQRARFDRLAGEIARRLAIRLRSESIPHFVTFRSKHPTDVANKLTKKRSEGKRKYIEAGANLGDVMLDLAGVRIVVYEPGLEKRAADIVRREFVLADGPESDIDCEKPPIEERTQADGYRASHLIVKAPDDDPLTIGAVCEVQVCNIVAHVFNEFEHDIEYKLKKATPSEKTKQALALVRRRTRELEEAVTDLMKRHKRDVSTQELEINDAQELRQGLEQVLGRTVTGDVETLFNMSRGFFSPLTVHHFNVRNAMEIGARLATQLGVMVTDDALLLSLALADTKRAEVSDFLAELRENHPDASGGLVDAIRQLVGGSRL